MIVRIIKKFDEWEDKIYESSIKTAIFGASAAILSFVACWTIYIIHHAF